MIKNDDEGMTFVCDECGEEKFFVATWKFVNAVGELKRLGWKIFKFNEWTYLCPKCKNKLVV